MLRAGSAGGGEPCQGILSRVLRDEALVAGLAELGFDAASSSPAELAARLKAGLEFWGPIVRATGFTAAD